MRERVLVVDDDTAMCDVLVEDLEQRGFSVRSATSGASALDRLREVSFDVVVTDVMMPGMSGIELCSAVRELDPELPVVVMTAFGSLDAAIEAIRAGAYDFVTKPLEPEALVVAIERAGERRRLRREVTRLQTAAFAETSVGLIGGSAPMRELRDLIARVAPTDATVLIQGESGTGKELVARALHDHGARPDGPFIALNCAALPEQLIDGELFGHARGAFTDARVDREGLLVEASGGTLFLDEVGELPLGLQAKLLRALQERKVRPLGKNREVPFDARIVAATNRDLDSATEEGSFRADLYYRLAVVTLDLPPLRVRGDDVLLLAEHFLQVFASRLGRPQPKVGAGLAEALSTYRWPGNVRELENCMHRAVILAVDGEVRLADLPPRLRDAGGTGIATPDPDGFNPLEEVERAYILRVLDAVGGNRSTAARILGIERRTIGRKLQRYAEDD